MIPFPDINSIIATSSPQVGLWIGALMPFAMLLAGMSLVGVVGAVILQIPGIIGDWISARSGNRRDAGFFTLDRTPVFRIDKMTGRVQSYRRYKSGGGNYYEPTGNARDGQFMSEE